MGKANEKEIMQGNVMKRQVQFETLDIDVGFESLHMR